MSPTSKALFAEWHLRKFLGNPSATQHQYNQLSSSDSNFLVPMPLALFLSRDGFCLRTFVSVSAILGSELFGEGWEVRSRTVL